jgi:hypothetical protein
MRRWKPLVEETKSATQLFVASRDYGTEGQNNPAQWGGLDGKKPPATGEVFFLDSLYRTPFIELTRHLCCVGRDSGDQFAKGVGLCGNADFMTF